MNARRIYILEMEFGIDNLQETIVLGAVMLQNVVKDN